MNRTTTSLPVCSRAILRCTHPNFAHTRQNLSLLYICEVHYRTSITDLFSQTSSNRTVGVNLGIFVAFCSNVSTHAALTGLKNYKMTLL